MGTSSKSLPREYISPALSIISIPVEYVICDSPLLGGIEDFDYEEW